jgi:tetratricopeptide (TPR) repeat protein
MRRVLALAVFLCATSLGTRAARADARERRVHVLQDLVAASDRQLAAGQRKRAERQLQSAVARYPGESVLLARYAALRLPLAAAQAPSAQAAAELLRLVERASAISSAQLVSQEPESDRQLLLHVALAQAVLGRGEDALATVMAAGRLLDPQTAACLRQVAALAVRAEQLDLAERALAAARQYVPQDRALAHELGLVLLARGKGQAAGRVLAERLAVDDNDLSARADLSFAIASEGRPGEALAMLTTTRAACSQERSCALLAARLALEAGRPEEASGFAAPLAQTGDLEALFVAADAATRAGKRDQARAHYEQVLRQKPDSVRAKLGLEQLAGSNESAR